MRNSLSCFIIFFIGFGLVACATEWKVVVGSNYDLIGFAGGSKAENSLLPVATNAAKRSQFAYLVAMRD